MKFKVKLVQRMTVISVAVLLAFVVLNRPISLAQSTVKPPERPLTLDQAVEFALANYPAVRASMERTLASKEGVSLNRLVEC